MACPSHTDRNHLSGFRPADCDNYGCTTQERTQWDEEGRRKATEEADERHRRRDEEVAEDQRQCAPQRAERARQQAENDVALKALRARLLGSPALAPDRNPLLGRWRIATATQPQGGDGPAQLMGMLADPGDAMCEVVFSGGVIEFKPASWASNDNGGDDSRGPILCRVQEKQVFALPDQGLPLLGFDIVDKNAIREFRLPDCTLVRVGEQPAAAPATHTSATTRGAAVPIAPARSAREPIEPVSRLGRARNFMVQRTSSRRCSSSCLRWMKAASPNLPSHTIR